MYQLPSLFFFQERKPPIYSDILQYVELELWSNEQCNKAYENSTTTFDPTTEICAYGKVISMKFLPNPLIPNRFIISIFSLKVLVVGIGVVRLFAMEN